jgi:hypothetical protein
MRRMCVSSRPSGIVVKKLEIRKLSFVTIIGLVYEAIIIYKTILGRHPSKSGENITVNCKCNGGRKSGGGLKQNNPDHFLIQKIFNPD